MRYTGLIEKAVDNFAEEVMAQAKGA